MNAKKSNRNEVRKDQIVVPMSADEKKVIVDMAKAKGLTTASFVRMVLSEHFAKET